MSGAHLHLLVNHVPILGTFFGLALLLWGALRRSDELVRAAWLGLLLSALFTLPAYLSGEPAEDAVEGRPQVSEALAERHEDAAQKGLAASLASGLVCLVALVAARGGRPPARAFVAATVALALVAGGLLGYVGHLGGQIRHAEIRADSGPSPQPDDGGQRGRHEHDDEH